MYRLRKLSGFLGVLCGSGVALFQTVNGEAAALKSSGCERQPPMAKGDYTEKDWPIEQRTTLGPVPLTVSRTFVVHVPAQHEAGGPLPVVINLHGSGSTGAQQDKWSSMREKGEAKGFVVVTPNAFPWREWTNSAADVYHRRGISDVTFVAMLLDNVVEKLCIDRNRIFATGLSNGGIMSATLARAGSEEQFGSHKIAAIAPVASMPANQGLGPPPWQSPPVACQTDALGELARSDAIAQSAESPLCDPPAGPPDKAVPMHVYFGNEDRLVANGFCYSQFLPSCPPASPFVQAGVRSFFCIADPPAARKAKAPKRQGIEGNPQNLVLAARCMVNFWAWQNGCAAKPVETKLARPRGWGVPIRTWKYNCKAVANSRADTSLTLYDVSERAPFKNNPRSPGGHIWPGAGKDVAYGGVFSGGDYPLTDRIWEFFEAHPR